MLSIFTLYYDYGLLFIIAEDFFICKNYIFQLLNIHFPKLSQLLCLQVIFLKLFGLPSLLAATELTKSVSHLHYSCYEISSDLSLLKFIINKLTTVRGTWVAQFVSI